MSTVLIPRTIYLRWVTWDLQCPNSLVFASDERWLYVADFLSMRRHHLQIYPVAGSSLGTG